MARASMREHYDEIAPGSRMVDPAVYDPSSGAPAFEQQYGLPFYEYLRQNPKEWELFNLKMEYGLREMVPPGAIERLKLPEQGVVADIGGGLGYLLARAKMIRRGLTTILCEQPFVCEQVGQMRQSIDTFWTEDIITGNLPPADIYFLSRIIHNWPDDEAHTILENIGRAAKKNARLKIIDTFLNEDHEGPPRALQQQRSMELLCGSKQHTVSEIGSLLLNSGWRINTQVVELSPDVSCLTAVKTTSRE